MQSSIVHNMQSHICKKITIILFFFFFILLVIRKTYSLIIGLSNQNYFRDNCNFLRQMGKFDAIPSYCSTTLQGHDVSTQRAVSIVGNIACRRPIKRVNVRLISPIRTDASPLDNRKGLYQIVSVPKENITLHLKIR